MDELGDTGEVAEGKRYCYGLGSTSLKRGWGVAFALHLS